MLAVPQHYSTHIAYAVAVHQHLSGGNAAAYTDGAVGQLDD